MHEIMWALLGATTVLVINEVSAVIEKRKNKKSFMPPADVQPPTPAQMAPATAEEPKPAPSIAEPPRQTVPQEATRTPADIDRDYIRHQRSIDDLLDRWRKAHFAVDKSRSLVERFENEKKERRLSEELKAERKAVEDLIEEFKEATKRVKNP